MMCSNYGIQYMSNLIHEGKLKVKQNIVFIKESFENMPVSFIGLFVGSNIGKIVVKALKQMMNRLISGISAMFYCLANNNKLGN